MKRLSLVCLMTVFVLFVTGLAVADVKRSRPAFRFESVKQMVPATGSGVISATNLLQAAANTSVYTDDFELGNGLTKDLGVFVSFSAVNSGTHVLYLQGSNLGGDTAGNWANIVEAASIEATVSTSAPVVTMATKAKISISAISDSAVVFRNIPRFKYYRFHLDADASNGPAVIDQLNVCSF